MAGSLILINGLVRMRWQRSIDSHKENPKVVCAFVFIIVSSIWGNQTIDNRPKGEARKGGGSR
jgi:hypothetical protein